jgi:hypothetical protein
MPPRTTPITRADALARLQDLDAERRAIYRAFPDLKPPATRQSRAPWPPRMVLRRAARAGSDASRQ